MECVGSDLDTVTFPLKTRKSCANAKKFAPAEKFGGGRLSGRAIFHEKGVSSHFPPGHISTVQPLDVRRGPCIPVVRTYHYHKTHRLF